MWERKYKELQVTLADEKKKLDEGLQIAEKQRTEAKETFEEVKFKKARLIEDRSKFNSVKANLENRAQEGVKMVKIKKEAVEKFHENMLEREEKLSKERRNFTAEKRKLKETLKASIFGRNRNQDWTPPSTNSPNKRSDSNTSSCGLPNMSNSTPRRKNRNRSLVSVSFFSSFATYTIVHDPILYFYCSRLRFNLQAERDVPDRVGLSDDQMLTCNTSNTSTASLPVIKKKSKKSKAEPVANHNNPSVPVSRTYTPVPVSRPTGQNNNEISADVKSEIKEEAKPVRDSTFDRFDPSRTRPILDRGAKRRFSDIIIID